MKSDKLKGKSGLRHLQVRRNTSPRRTRRRIRARARLSIPGPYNFPVYPYTARVLWSLRASRTTRALHRISLVTPERVHEPLSPVGGDLTYLERKNEVDPAPWSGREGFVHEGVGGVGHREAHAVHEATLGSVWGWVGGFASTQCTCACVCTHV